jgi:hypothetical protein
MRMRPEPLSWRLALTALTLDLTVSGNLLTDFGSSYISEGGSFVEKLHPGSCLAILAGAARIVHGGHGLQGLRRLAARHAAVFVFLLGMAFCGCYALLFSGAGNVIALADTFLPAGMLVLALCDRPAVQMRQVRRLLQLLLALNACIALAEAATTVHLVPIVLEAGDTETEFRPTALYDHPLTGAAATMLGVFLAPSRQHAPWLGLFYQVLMFAALIAFSERVPLALSIVVLAGRAAGQAARRVVGRRIAWRQAVAAVSAAGLAMVLAAAAMAAGLGQRLEAHLYWDPSAQVRLRQFDILNMLAPAQIVFGCRRADFLALFEPLRLAYGMAVVEDFWLVMFVTLGALCFPVFVLSLAALLRWLWRMGGADGHAMVATLLIAASTSNSLGRKSMLLVLLAGCVMTAREGRAGQAVRP